MSLSSFPRCRTVGVFVRTLLAMTAATVLAAAPVRAQLSVAGAQALDAVPRAADRARTDTTPPLAASHAAETRTSYFYTGKRYGSESEFNPLSELLNEGFDVLNSGYDRHILREPLDVGFRTVFRSMTHPFTVIKEYGGFGRVVHNELLPLSAEGSGGGAWTGNYGLHLFGSGMVSARMREWYEAHGIAHPELLADLTMAATHVLNEVAEASREDGLREETLPDLYLFDPMGILLYHFQSVDRLMSNDRVQLTSWPFQPTFVMPDSTLENVGQTFALKVRLPGATRWSAFVDLGLDVQGGLSYRFDDTDAITVAGGPYVASFKIVDSKTQKMSVGGWGYDYTVYYDRDNSLLGSFTVDQQKRTSRLNVYPAFVHVGGFSPGFFAQAGQSRVQFGIAGNWGFGLGYGRRR